MKRDQRPWGAIELGLPTNRKLRGADARAKWLYVVTLLWCNQELNDGVFMPRVAVALADVPNKFVRELVNRDLFHEKGHACPRCPQPSDADDLVVHDFGEHNRSADKVHKIRTARAAAGQLANHTRWKHEGTVEDCESCSI